MGTLLAHSTFRVRDELEANLNLGGVRIEDNVLITADGSESFTSVPRTVKEIEALMAS